MRKDRDDKCYMILTMIKIKSVTVLLESGGKKITGAIPGHVVLSMCLFSCAGKNKLAENPHAPELPDLLIHLYLSE